MTTLCEGCNEPIDNRPAGAYGGDWYSSCNICEWHSEDEGSSTIKQGLTHEELVAHKKQLNLIRSMVYVAWLPKQSQQLTEILDTLDNASKELITEE